MNFAEPSGSTEPTQRRQKVQDLWLLMHPKTRTNVPETRLSKLTRQAFHVINVTLLGSPGMWTGISSSSGSATMSSPRFARFVEDSTLGSCLTFDRKTTTGTVPEEHVLYQSLLAADITQQCRRMTPTCHRATLNM